VGKMDAYPERGRTKKKIMGRTKKGKLSKKRMRRKRRKEEEMLNSVKSGRKNCLKK